MSTWTEIDKRDDHYLGLPGANVVAAEALLALLDSLADVVAGRAMMCVHGNARRGKTLSVNASLRALAPADTCRVQFRARPTPRDIRHVLFLFTSGLAVARALSGLRPGSQPGDRRAGRGGRPAAAPPMLNGEADAAGGMVTGASRPPQICDH